MVYIHGGSFYLGRAADHPPNYLLERDVTLVAIQYRLGALGFLSTMSSTIPGNAAMLDIIMALKWVQDHISDFGGDPQRVTIFGQSAGAAAASALLYSPIVPASYFSQVILQSGGSASAWSIDPNPIENAKEIAKYAGCDIVRPIEDVERCLQELPVLSLLKALDMHSQDRMVNQGVYNIGGCGMVIGGPSGFLTADPIHVMRSGQVRKDVRMMAGATKHDGSFMMTGLYDMLAAMELINNTQYNQYDLIDTANRVFGIDEHSGALAGYEIETLFAEQDLKSGNFSQLMAGLIDVSI
uniref:Carboxylic ester hydrolase n=1 Tax=Anopheles maculatus TaxID=74869 RepID=A0A182T3Z8_9DIPT